MFSIVSWLGCPVFEIGSGFAVRCRCSRYSCFLFMDYVTCCCCVVLFLFSNVFIRYGLILRVALLFGTASVSCLYVLSLDDVLLCLLCSQFVFILCICYVFVRWGGRE